MSTPRGIVGQKSADVFLILNFERVCLQRKDKFSTAVCLSALLFVNKIPYRRARAWYPIYNYVETRPVDH